jgi:DMSO/TMAO reductase YedYZ heme-binding membrane subunit
MDGKLWWYTTRASGLVAWSLLAASVVWGLLLSTKAVRSRPRPAWVVDLHRFLGAAGVVFVGIHVSSIVLDNFVDFGWADILVPLVTGWHPVAVAWGIVAFYLLIAVEITSLLRAHLPPRGWRMTHLLSFPLFASATGHLLSAGTDRHQAAVRTVVILVSAAIGGLTAVRASAAARSRRTQGVVARPVEVRAGG